MKLSDGEKLILVMLCEIYQNLKIKDGVDPEFVLSAIHGGHHWGLKWQYPGIFHGEEIQESTVSEVCDVLDMWSLLEHSHAELSDENKARVETEADPFGKDVAFRGFDGNNEGEHYSIARFLIDDLRRFSEFKDRDLNSHMPSIDGYRRMLSVFKPMRQALLVGGEPALQASQIIEILKEWIHPDNR